MNRLIGVGFSAVCMLVWTGVGHSGAMYKCKDAEGNITFSDTACAAAGGDIEEIRVQHSRPASTPASGDEYWSVERQVQRMKAERAAEEEQRALRDLVNEELSRQQESQRQAEQRRAQAERLMRDAQDRYQAAGRAGGKKQKALIEEGRSLERQADVLLGRRETVAPTQVERLQERVEEAEEQARRARDAAQSAENAARNAENAARRR